MNFRHAARQAIFLAAFLFAAPMMAQEKVGGSFYADCVKDRAAITMELSNHLRITVYGAVKPDEAYRTNAQTFEGESATMEVSLCPADKEICQSVEGVLTTYKSDDNIIEAAIEYFDGTEVQGDSESIEGKIVSFTIHKDKSKAATFCKS